MHNISSTTLLFAVGIIIMITRKQKTIRLFALLMSITASIRAMEDTLPAEKERLRKLPLTELMAATKDCTIHKKLRAYALNLLIHQKDNFELQALARIFLCRCYRLGTLPKESPDDSAYELVAQINSLSVSEAIKKQAKDEITILMASKHGRSSNPK